MNIYSFDLNLLRVLDALLRERNVSRAAERLSLSQPAVSNALNRLRELLDDPLLVRVGRVMQPTPRALSLEAPIRDALQQIEHTLNAGDFFDPATSRQRFVIAVTDYVELICMPPLMAHLAKLAPGIQLGIQHLTPSLPAEALDNGAIDLAVGRFLDVPTRFHTRRWASETLQVALRKQHPLIDGDLDLTTFLRLRHLWVHGGQTRGMVDQWLEDHDLARDVVYTTPNYLQAAHIVASSDLAAVLPTGLARHFAGLLPLQLFDLPFDLGTFQLDIVSVAQRERDAALQWLIEQIVAVVEKPPQ
ncbi:LysR family transcriptional regulator [Stutzerimonas xanthomarina]|uniref:Transcriptional regulator, LysR family n=2 Tax=Stutzerimonas xanthomarina TaxID=271420 RepID=A0A1M5L6R5_9GAMM|nr:LysR family transcriptional regulator [Stutzerimonas xanthomarina]MCP9340308.1 LysR family transcriptional regulator [Stutzerimonas xanthomarina]SEH51315.1 DNA-binding transcriptional regulator, LysR family [Stutzerimonas xanthomarina]SHG60646.1 transcriptional regulator, LysR family [Stutzerimonas xanthomarina DSM 18231]